MDALGIVVVLRPQHESEDAKSPASLQTRPDEGLDSLASRCDSPVKLGKCVFLREEIQLDELREVIQPSHELLGGAF